MRCRTRSRQPLGGELARRAQPDGGRAPSPGSPGLSRLPEAAPLQVGRDRHRHKELTTREAQHGFITPQQPQVLGRVPVDVGRGLLDAQARAGRITEVAPGIAWEAAG